MVVPKKVYVHAGLEQKPRSRSRGAANGRRRSSFPFPFRSSGASDDSSISSNSYMDEEDDLQPVFQDVADALYKNSNPFMETALIDFSKRAKSEEDDDRDGDDGSEVRRGKAKKLPLGRLSLKPKSKPERVRSQRREERHIGRKNKGTNARQSNGQATKTKEQPLDQALEKIHTGQLSFESDEPIATERREPAVSVRTEELVIGKHPAATSATRQPSFANTNQNRKQPTKRNSLPHNKPRRAVTETKAKKKDTSPVKVHLPTNLLLSHSDAFEGRNTEMHKSRSVDSKKRASSGATPKLTTTGGLIKTSRTRSLRARSHINLLEAIPAFPKSSSHGSRGRALGLRIRSLSRNRSRSRDNREWAASVSNSSPSLPPSQQASLSNASEPVSPIQPSRAQESQAVVDVVTLDARLAQVFGDPSEIFDSLAKELEALCSCSNWFTEPKLEAAAVVDCRNDTSTQKETADASVHACEQRDNPEDTDIKIHETSASVAAPENIVSQPPTNQVTPLDGFRSYMNFMIAASKQQLTLNPSYSPSTTREFPPPRTPLDPAATTGSSPPPTTTTTTVDQQVAADRSMPGGFPPLSPQKPTKRTRSGNLQMLRIRFRRDSNFAAGSRAGSRGSGCSRTSDSTPSLLIEP
jgi:hypothetical protein